MPVTRDTSQRVAPQVRSTPAPRDGGESHAAPRGEDALRRLAAVAVEVKASLAESRRALETEVRLYPTPIPRCDAQFNHLYEQRSRVSALLARVDSGLERGDAAVLAGACAEFVRLPDGPRDPAHQRLCERVETVLASAQGTPGR